LFAGLTTQNATLLFAAPLMAWLPELPLFRRIGPRIRGGLRVVLTAALVIITLVLARQKFAADSARSPQPTGEPTLSDYLDYGK